MNLYYIILRIKEDFELTSTLGVADFKLLVYYVNSITLLYTLKAYLAV